jgi:hypothetical protein
MHRLSYLNLKAQDEESTWSWQTHQTLINNGWNPEEEDPRVISIRSSAARAEYSVIHFPPSQLSLIAPISIPRFLGVLKIGACGAA